MLKFLQRIGAGKLWLRIRSLRYAFAPWKLRASFAKAKHLGAIARAMPILAGEGEIEIHMLLHHKRVWEGLWALYSFANLAGQPFRMVIHDDGSLTGNDRNLIQDVFPSLNIIGKMESGEALERHFLEKGLARCLNLRRRLVLARKLFDSVFLSRSEWIILMDSDVLFYHKPVEILQPYNFYSVDNGYRYSFSASEMDELLGRKTIGRCNSGLIRIRRGQVDFEQIERWLSHPGFWTTVGSANYFAEQTLWAMVLTLAEARPLPETYRICAPEPEKFTYGHYCGGGYWASLYYTRGLPYLRQRIVC